MAEPDSGAQVVDPGSREADSQTELEDSREKTLDSKKGVESAPNVACKETEHSGAGSNAEVKAAAPGPTAAPSRAEPADSHTEAVDTVAEAADTVAEAVDTVAEAVHSETETVDTVAEVAASATAVPDSQAEAVNFESEAVGSEVADFIPEKADSGAEAQTPEQDISAEVLTREEVEAGTEAPTLGAVDSRTEVLTSETANSEEVTDPKAEAADSGSEEASPRIKALDPELEAVDAERKAADSETEVVEPRTADAMEEKGVFAAEVLTSEAMEANSGAKEADVGLVELSEENADRHGTGMEDQAVTRSAEQTEEAGNSTTATAVAAKAPTVQVEAIQDSEEDPEPKVATPKSPDPVPIFTAAPDDTARAGPESPADKPLLLSIRTQTEAVQASARSPDSAEGEGELLPIRRAVSDWAIVDRSSSTAHIRSERIRRTAQLFEALAQAQEERHVSLTRRRNPTAPAPRAAPVPASRATAAPAVAPRVVPRASAPIVLPPPEREVLLVPLSPPPEQPSRRVNAILALSGGGGAADSDDERDERDEEVLWEKVRAKIAARRSMFQRLESRQEEEKRDPPAGARSPGRLSAERTSWLTNGTQAAPQSKPATASRQQKQPQVAAQRQQKEWQVAAAGQQKEKQVAEQEKLKTVSATKQVAEPVKGQARAPSKKQVAAGAEQKVTSPASPAQNGQAEEISRSSFGKYIDQRQEQEVLRSLGSSVLARQKLASREKARDQLTSERAEAERRRHRAENQRTDARCRLEKTRGRLTRDSAFERKGLEALITRLDGSISEETRKMDKLASQIAEADAAIEELRRRAAA